MKDFIKFVLLVALFSYLFVSMAEQWPFFEFSMSGDILEGFMGTAIITFLVICFLICLALGIAGFIAFTVLCVIGAVFMAGLSVLWPVLLLVGLIWLISGSSTSRA